MFKYPNGSYAVVSQTLAAFEHHQTVKVSGTKGALWAGWSGALDRTLEPTFFLKVFDGETLEEVKLEKQSGEVFELRAEIAECVRMARGEETRVARAWMDCGPPGCVSSPKNPSASGGLACFRSPQVLTTSKSESDCSDIISLPTLRP
jgi:hypothetical protein